VVCLGAGNSTEWAHALPQWLAQEPVRAGDVRLLGPNTNLNAFEDFRPDLEGPSIALITQSGHQGRPVFQGQEIGIRLTHWAPTGNEVDLEFADFARHFADQPEVGVIACYIEGFKDGRTLMLAADHAARLRKPMVMVKVGKTEAGRSMAQSHTGHLTGSDAVTSADRPDRRPPMPWRSSRCWHVCETTECEASPWRSPPTRWRSLVSMS